MDKKSKTILMVIAIVLIIVALFIPYTKKKEEPIKLTKFSCSDVSENQENNTKLNKISCNTYQDLTTSDEKNLILIARPSCGYCTKFIPILEEIVDEYKITANYFDTDALSKTEIKDFYDSAELFTRREFGTPSLIITKNGKIVKYNIGYMDKDATISFLKDAKIINE